MNQLEKAIQLAVKAHADQLDKGHMPYILHPLRVMMKMEKEQEMVTAVLHDVIEDCKEITAIKLEEEHFDQEVIDALIVLNRNNYPNYEQYIVGCSKNPIARKVKIADLDDNIDTLRLESLTDKDLERVKKYHRAYFFLKY